MSDDLVRYERDTYREQRDKLLAALEAMVSQVHCDPTIQGFEQQLRDAEAAIAKARAAP